MAFYLICLATLPEGLAYVLIDEQGFLFFPIAELILFFVQGVLRAKDVMKIVTTFVYMALQIL